MRLQLNKTVESIGLTRELAWDLIGGLIVAQAVMACYLLALDGKAALLFAALCGIPVALLFSLLLRRGSAHHHTQMAIVMFTFGGFGMMLGCAADLGHTGLLGLLSVCQSMPLSLLPDPGQIWQKMRLTPWTYVGMFVGGNLGMLLIKELRPGIHLGLFKAFYIYAICNLGMLMGMLMGEAIATRIAVDINQFVAAGLMMALMLLGMTLGMVAMLTVAERCNQKAATAW